MPEEFRRATWLELFYDVAFVALVAQLTYLIYEHHHTITDIINIFIVGYSIFIAWWATTANRNLQPKEIVVDKLLVQLQMAGAFLMSITMPATFEGEYAGFFVSFAVVRLLQSSTLIAMYYRYPDTRPVTYNILQGFLIASALWMISGFMPSPGHFIVAGAALALDILVPLTRGKGNTTRYLNVHHLQERMGLFLMLVLGESMIVVALANTAVSLRSPEPVVIFSGLFLIVAFWWLYFEHSDRHSGERPKNLFLFLHAHGFLFGSVILLSVGYKLLLSSKPEDGLIFVFLGAGGMAVALGVIRASMYTLHGRGVIVASILALLFALVIYVGLVLEFYTVAVASTAILFGVIAILDFKGAFQRLHNLIERNHESPR